MMKEEIEYWRERKETAEEKWGIVNLKHQLLETLKNLDLYRRQLEEVTRDLEEKEAIVKYLAELRELENEGLPTVSAGLLGAVRETSVERLRNKLMDFRLLESELATKYTEEHQKLKELREQIEETRLLLASELDALLAINRTQIDIMRSRQQYMRQMVQQFEEESETYPEKQLEIERIETALTQIQRNWMRRILRM